MAPSASRLMPRDDPGSPAAAAGARRGLRYLGALLLFGIGAVHLQQYLVVDYRVIPVIGSLFAANFVGAGLLGVALLAPLERVPRVGRLLARLVALGGIGLAAGTLIGLLLSEAGTLFGFHEQGYRLAIKLSLVLEAAAIVVLALFLVLPDPSDRSTPAA